MSEQSVIGVYGSLSKAEEAVYKLDWAGFPIKQVSIVGQHLEQEEVQGYVTVADIARKGLRAGAWAGGLFGLLTVAASVWIPEVGRLLVAGPLATALLGFLGGLEGAVAGAAWGGVLGTLVGWGVSKQHIIKYEEHLKAGKYLLIAHGSAAEVEHARHILHSTAVEDLHLHSGASI